MKNNHRNGFLDPKNILLDILHDYLWGVSAKKNLFWKISKIQDGGHFGGHLVFKITGMFYMIFDCFIGSGMVENIYIDNKIMTLSWLLKLELFLPIFNMLSGHFGGHFVFIDNGYVFIWFLRASLGREWPKTYT